MGGRKKAGCLTVDFSRRLPDINSERAVPPEYLAYGRFAVLAGGGLWFAPVMSSHPRDTRDGYYRAIGTDGSTLYVSPRGYAGKDGTFPSMGTCSPGSLGRRDWEGVFRASGKKAGTAPRDRPRPENHFTSISSISKMRTELPGMAWLPRSP